MRYHKSFTIVLLYSFIFTIVIKRDVFFWALHSNQGQITL
jgi:hypothetical protein